MKENTTIINNLIEGYIEEGKKVILPEKIDKWTHYVKYTHGNLQSLHEIAFALSIIKSLDYGEPMETAINILNNITCPVETNVIRSIVANYSIRGPEFFEKTAVEPIPEGNIEYLEKLKRENTKLMFIHIMRNDGYDVEQLPNGHIMVNAFEEEVKLSRNKNE